MRKVINHYDNTMKALEMLVNGKDAEAEKFIPMHLCIPYEDFVERFDQVIQIFVENETQIFLNATNEGENVAIDT